MLLRQLVLAGLVLLPLASAAGQERNINYDLIVASRNGNTTLVGDLLDRGAKARLPRPEW